MGLFNPEFSSWLIPWSWWLLIGLAVGFVLLLGLCVLVTAKQADERLKAYELEHRNGRNKS